MSEGPFLIRHPSGNDRGLKRSAWFNKSWWCWWGGGGSTCCYSFYLVRITRPWHLLRLFMQMLDFCLPALRRSQRSHSRDRGKYQSLARGIFIFSATWGFVSVTRRWCIGSDCSWALTAHKAISKEIILPWGWIFFKLYQLKKKVMLPSGVSAL